MKGYGERIKKYRNFKKYTQEELGNKVGVTKSFISKLESESTKPSLEMLSQIAKALDADVGELIGNKIDPPDALKKQGTKWMVLGEKLEKRGITPQQVEEWAEIVRFYTENNK